MVANDIRRARELLRAGHAEEATAQCNRLLASHPDAPDVLELLGNILLHRGNPAEAQRHLEHAARLAPQSIGILVNLGVAQLAGGAAATAEDTWRKALALDPSSIEARARLGDSTAARGAFDEALSHYRAALEQEPGNTNLICRLGRVQLQQNRTADAFSSFSRAIELDPGLAEAHFYIGSLHLGNANVDQALRHFEQVLRFHPDSPETHNNIGVAHYMKDELDHAAGSYRRAIELAPRYAEALNNLGTLLQRQGKIPEARNAYDAALTVHPDNLLWKFRAATLCTTVAGSRDEIAEYRENLSRTLQRFTELRPQVSPEQLVAAGIYPPYALMYHGQDDRTIREQYACAFEHTFPAYEPSPRSGRPRIGFLVTRMHEDIFLRSMSGVIGRMNPDLADLYIICAAGAGDHMRRQFPDRAIGIIPLSGHISQDAESIRRANMDVLYYWEIATDATNYCLPFYRLAPVQCTSWGIQVTSGIPTVDYYLSSEQVEPVDAENHYTEQLIRARDLLSYQFPRARPKHFQPRKHFGIDDTKNLYFAVHQIGKFHPDFDPVMADILREDPDAVIVIARDRWGHAAGQLEARFAKTIPDVVERILFVPRLQSDEYYSLLDQSDVILDTPYYGGVNVTYDALSFGKPVVATRSPLHIGRYAAACLERVGATECIAGSLENYAEVAVNLGRDRDRRLQIADTIREGCSKLFENENAVREHERIFEFLITQART